MQNLKKNVQETKTGDKKNIEELENISADERIQLRTEKFSNMGN